MICIKEVGVDLELCVHAHENDVDRLGSFLQNDYPAVWFFRYSWNWFLTVMVPTMLSWSNISDGNSFQCLVYFWQGWSIYCDRSIDPVLLLSCSTFEYYPLVSRRCLAIAPHLTNFVEVMSFLVVITLRVLGCCQPRTPTSEIIPHYKSNTPSIFTGKFWTQSGHS